MVAVFGETGHLALRRVYQNMANDSEGKQIIADNPRISSKTKVIEMLANVLKEPFRPGGMETLGLEPNELIYSIN